MPAPIRETTLEGGAYVLIAKRWKLLNVIRTVAVPLLALLAWDVLIAVLYVRFGKQWVSIGDLPMTLIGSALALLITFRNNNAYARWWEGRQLWGGVVNSSRTLARQVRLYLPEHLDAAMLVRLQIAYAHALRCHLRQQDPWGEIEPHLPAGLAARLRGTANVPNAILAEIAERLAGLRRAGALDSIEAAAFDGTMATLTNMQGGMERIKNTPMPRQYTVLPRVFVRLFCILLPTAMVADLGWKTPLGSTLLGFIFLALDRAGWEVENPFENSENDVPMTSITRTIEINLREGLGDADLPKPLQPIDGVLW